jgi:two-component SAPR family response regulator
MKTGPGCYKNHLQRSGRFNLIGTYRNALEVKDALEREEVDLIFLDIQLPGMTGLNFLLFNRSAPGRIYFHFIP